MVGADIGLLGIYGLSSPVLLAGPPLVSSSVRWRRRKLDLPGHVKDPTGSFSRAVSTRPGARKASGKVCRMFPPSSARGRAPLPTPFCFLWPPLPTVNRTRMTFLLTWGQVTLRHVPTSLPSLPVIMWTCCPLTLSQEEG